MSMSMGSSGSNLASHSDNNNNAGNASMNNSTRPPFDLPSHLRQSHEKINGVTPRTSSHASMKNGVVDGDYGDPVGGRVSADRDQHSHQGQVHTQDGSLASIPNGRTSAGSWEQHRGRNENQYLGNGVVNGAGDAGRRSPGPSASHSHTQQNGTSRLSNGERASAAASTNGALTNGRSSNELPRTNGTSVEPFNRTDVPGPISTNPQSTGPLTYNSSLTPASPGTGNAPGSTEAPPRSHTVSPHRFSSPPAYVNPLAPSPSTSSLPQPSQPPLKHRHTLQVPKPGAVPGRNSRDGEEAVYSSGRFSPTALATVATRRGSLSLNRRNTQSIHSNMPQEEIPPDEDAMRWAEAVRQKRASKRKRKDDEEDDRVVVGTKVDQNHVNWVTAYNMLTGIRFTVSRTNAKMDRPLTDADFDAKHKFSFDM